MQDKHETPGIIYDKDKYLNWREVAEKMPSVHGGVCKDKRTVLAWVKLGKLPRPTDTGLFREIDVIEHLTRVSD